MIAVAESGSTKCDWLLTENGEILAETHTKGFNPFFHSVEFIAEELAANPVLMAHAAQITKVHFYGAGCSSEERNEIVMRGLLKAFPHAACTVGHDLHAAAYATYTGEPGIVCILGTGSNSCYYDGHEITEVVPALGHMLGDEGSGSWFGRKLLSSFLYHRLPADIEAAFIKEYNLNKEEIFRRVYNMPGANVFMASFMRFLSGFKNHPWVEQMIEEGFHHFAEIHIACYPNYREVPVHFVGSVAYHFKHVLERTAAQMGFRIGVIDAKPAYSLLRYHLNQETRTNDPASV